MKYEEVNTIERAIYKKKFCIKAKYRMFRQFPDGNYQTNTIYCIDGGRVDYSSEIIGELSAGVKYIFWRDALKRLHPVRVTASRKTLNNMDRGRKRFWHLRPESESMSYEEYYNK